MPPNPYHLPAGSAAAGGCALDLSPQRAGWRYTSLRVVELAPGGRYELTTEDSEWIVLPLSGGCAVAVEGQTYLLHGRPDVFTSVTDFAYLPRDATATLTSDRGGRFALTGARCDRRLPPRYRPAHTVAVELRGRGSCARQVNNFAAAHTFEADRLIAVEVLTPAGNWSSYPPHKHDEHRPGEESVLEEVYYFEFATSPLAPDTPGYGYQRVTPSGQGSRTELLAEVRGGDVVLIPDGWHGPSIAAPGHHMYYLNVMAGPGDERAWLISDHPHHSWVRESWPAQPADPRLPLYTAPGPPGPSGAGAETSTESGTESGTDEEPQP